MQHANQCSHCHVSINIIDPPTSLSYTADDKNKAPQPEESPLEPENYLHESLSAEFTTPIEILPFFLSHNIDIASCETSTSDCCEER